MYKFTDRNNVVWEITKMQYKCWCVFVNDGYIKSFDSYPAAKAYVTSEGSF